MAGYIQHEDVDLGSGSFDSDTVILIGVQPGSTIAVVAFGYATAANGEFVLNAPTDDQANSYARAAQSFHNGSGDGVDIWYAYDVAGGDTEITIDPTGADNYGWCCVIEILGNGGADPLDDVDTGGSNNSNTATTTLASGADSSTDKAVAVAVLSWTTASTITNTSSGWNNLKTLQTGGTLEDGAIDYKELVAIASGITDSWQRNAGLARYSSALAIFKYVEPAAGGQPTMQRWGGVPGMTSNPRTGRGW